MLWVMIQLDLSTGAEVKSFAHTLIVQVRLPLYAQRVQPHTHTFMQMSSVSSCQSALNNTVVAQLSLNVVRNY